MHTQDLFMWVVVSFFFFSFFASDEFTPILVFKTWSKSSECSGKACNWKRLGCWFFFPGSGQMRYWVLKEKRMHIVLQPGWRNCSHHQQKSGQALWRELLRHASTFQSERCEKNCKLWFIFTFISQNSERCVSWMKYEQEVCPHFPIRVIWLSHLICSLWWNDLQGDRRKVSWNCYWACKG